MFKYFSFFVNGSLFRIALPGIINLISYLWNAKTSTGYASIYVVTSMHLWFPPPLSRRKIMSRGPWMEGREAHPRRVARATGAVPSRSRIQQNYLGISSERMRSGFSFCLISWKKTLVITPCDSVQHIKDEKKTAKHCKPCHKGWIVFVRQKVALQFSWDFIFSATSTDLFVVTSLISQIALTQPN